MDLFEKSIYRYCIINKIAFMILCLSVSFAILILLFIYYLLFTISPISFYAFTSLLTIFIVFSYIELFFYKRLADFNCGHLLSMIMNNERYYEMKDYTIDQGLVEVMFKIDPGHNTTAVIVNALVNNKLLYVKNALYYVSFKKIIYIYHCYKDGKDILIRHLLKNFNINLFLNKILNDIKPIIYHYYLHLCLTT